MELSKNKRSDEFIKLTSNPAQGKGGSSFGDSGGPILLRDTNIILGLVSYGTNYNCAGIEYAARVNTSDVLNWLYTYLLPQYFSIIELKFID
ncbi:MAG TPA: trypsin-like serine protease [Dehalococcoidia bacterium]|nr:trypsin-like serine protease [Dehalococcoidia bacterium]